MSELVRIFYANEYFGFAYSVEDAKSMTRKYRNHELFRFISVSQDSNASYSQDINLRGQVREYGDRK